MHIITINEPRQHEFEGEQEGVYRVFRDRKEMGELMCPYSNLQSKRKTKCKHKFTKWDEKDKI